MPLGAALLLGLASPAYAGWTAGAIPGQFAVNPTGAANYTIPLTFPVSVGHLAPKLSLVYNSQHPNGLAGRGWTLSGLSSITRCGQTMAQDNAIAPVTFTSSDDYCLDGQKLMQASDGTYRTELDNFTQITSMCGGGSTGTLCQWFKAQLKNGLTYIYGATADSQILAQGSYFSSSNCGSPTHAMTRVWALSEIVDRSGNAITFHYAQDNTSSSCTGDYWPSYITYSDKANLNSAAYAITQAGPNKITFTYSPLTGSSGSAPPDLNVMYRGGASIGNIQVLSGIAFTSTSNGAVASQFYDLQYQTDQSTGYSQLTSVTECAGSATCTNSNVSPSACPSSDSCFHSTKVIWGNSTSTQQGWSGFTLNATGQGSGPAYGFVMDVFGDGTEAFVFPNTDQYNNMYGWNVIAKDATDDNISEWYTPSTFPAVLSPIGFPINYYGNGQQSLVEEGANGHCKIITFSRIPPGTLGWTSADTGIPCIQVAGGPENLLSNTIVADINGDGLDDIIQINGGSVVAYLNSTTGFNANNPITLSTIPSGVSSPARPGRDGVYNVEFNGDGCSDLLLNPGNGKLTAYVSNCNQSNPQFTAFYTITGASTAYFPVMLDLNGDGLTDIAYVNASNNHWMLAVSTGTSFVISDSGQVATNPASARAVDFSGTGRQGLFWLGTGSGYWYVYQPYYSASSQQWLFTSQLPTGITATDLPDPSIQQVGNNYAYSPVVIADLEGNGFTDIIGGTPTGNLRQALHATNPVESSPLLVSSITDGLGNSVQFNYVPITLTDSNGVYSTPSGGPNYTYPQAP
jgi:hypothetical protein